MKKKLIPDTDLIFICIFALSPIHFQQFEFVAVRSLQEKSWI